MTQAQNTIVMITGGTSSSLPNSHLSTDTDIWRTAAGPYATVEAFEPLLRKSSSPRIINVTLGACSLSRHLKANTPLYKVREPQ